MKRFNIPTSIREEIVERAVAELPNECCGLLVGRGDTVTHCFPLVNELASPTRFRSESASMFRAMKAIRELELDVLAIYHSHPTSDAVPSKRDIEEANWPNVAMVILSLKSEPTMRAWRIDQLGYAEVGID